MNATGSVLRDIGSRLEILVDDWLIDRLDGVQLRLHSPVRREVALPFDAPWEGAVSFYVAMLECDGEYRAYFRGQEDEKSGDVVAVAKGLPDTCWGCAGWLRTTLISGR